MKTGFVLFAALCIVAAVVPCFEAKQFTASRKLRAWHSTAEFKNDGEMPTKDVGYRMGAAKRRSLSQVDIDTTVATEAGPDGTAIAAAAASGDEAPDGTASASANSAARVTGPASATANGTASVGGR